PADGLGKLGPEDALVDDKAIHAQAEGDEVAEEDLLERQARFQQLANVNPADRLKLTAFGIDRLEGVALKVALELFLESLRQRVDHTPRAPADGAGGNWHCSSPG